MNLTNKQIKATLEVLFLLILFLTTFLTMPFLLDAVDSNPVVGINYICLIITMIYIIKIKIKSQKNESNK